VPLAFGSDFPVEIADPLWGIYAGLTRRNEHGQPEGGWHAEHLLTLEETLRGFTLGSAYASFDENRLGQLSYAHRSDLTIFDRDLFKVDPDSARKAKVVMTIIDGEVVFDGAAR
jgi:predicted amidohydrolase YtcJ